MWLDISIAISCAVAGLAGGWVMRSIGLFDDHDPNMLVTLNDSRRLSNERLEEVAQGRISEVAGRLHDYASTMAMDVDAHQTRVQAVNNTLQEQEDDGTTDAVYRAVDELIAANDSMQEKLRVAQERIQEQAEQLESAEQKAHTDGLTRIANRRAFDDHLDQQFDLGEDEAGTLAILDVDHFKQFNDTYGHRAGDEVLRVVASILKARLNPYGIAARFGGEEFAIVMDGMAVETAAEIINHARQAIGERDVHFGEKRLRVTMSAGIAGLMPSESKEDWLQRADDALYHSKEQGRDCAHWMDVTTPVLVGTTTAGAKPVKTPDSKAEVTSDQSPQETTADTASAPAASAPAANGVQDRPATADKPPAVKAKAENETTVPDPIASEPNASKVDSDASEIVDNDPTEADETVGVDHQDAEAKQNAEVTEAPEIGATQDVDDEAKGAPKNDTVDVQDDLDELLNDSLNSNDDVGDAVNRDAKDDDAEPENPDAATDSPQSQDEDQAAANTASDSDEKTKAPATEADAQGDEVVDDSVTDAQADTSDQADGSESVTATASDEPKEQETSKVETGSDKIDQEESQAPTEDRDTLKKRKPVQPPTSEATKKETLHKADSRPRQAFKYLPDTDGLAKAMTDLHQRSQTANIPLHVMAIRFSQDAETETTEALLQIVRATLRSVDRIGCDDASTLLVCMPNLDADSAFERGQQICHAAKTLSNNGNETAEHCHVSIGLANAANDPDFFQVVENVKQAAVEANANGNSVLFADEV
tara:strand:+ start:194760 stop:197054 length:2295 start_codon:yes stop_codon:yes gene_type:complete